MYMYMNIQIPERYLRPEHTQLIESYSKSPLDLDCEGCMYLYNVLVHVHACMHACILHVCIIMYMCMQHYSSALCTWIQVGQLGCPGSSVSRPPA